MSPSPAPAAGPGRYDSAAAAADPARHAAGRASPGLVYPGLPAAFDALFARVGGAGIGNCLFAYFHAVLLAHATGRRLVAPAWTSIGIGALRRGDHSRRRYGTMFRRHADEIGSARKAWLLASLWSRRAVVAVGVGGVGDLPPASCPLVVVRLAECRFGPLLAHRRMVRHRLLEVMATPPRTAPRWGSADYAAVHVRLGDFAPAGGADLAMVNTRLPMAWYVHAVAQVRATSPGLPIRLFSDGHAAELGPLLALDGVRLEREVDDVNELLTMASARVLVGSNSTFSQWAAFLGNMPTIWAAAPPERLCDDHVPVTVLARP